LKRNHLRSLKHEYVTMTDLYINEDNQSFYNSRPECEMTHEGVDRVVDVATQFPVTGIAFCVNVQRALYESKVWETFYGDYDPDKGEEQPALWRRHGARNLWLLAQRGIDHHARWLARCEHHGIEGWLSMRMNDCHGLKEYCQDQQGVPQTHWTRHWPSIWWRNHPELRRAPYRDERSWEGAFDYTHQSVRQHHMALIRELLERYDMFGLELDWMRWGMMFAPGKEQAGLAILTQFMRQTRELANESAMRVGHPVQLAVRLPSEPASCLAMGYDILRWADEGLIDRVILSSFLGNANFDYPIDIWRRLLGSKIKLIANVEPIASAYPGVREMSHSRVISNAITMGAAASAIHRGVDGIHLFNHCPSKLLKDDSLFPIYRHVADLDAIQCLPRRQAVTYPQVRAPGQASGALLPIDLQVPCIGVDFGRMEQNITVRIATGPRPSQGTVYLQLGFSADTPPLNGQELHTRVNGILCPTAHQQADQNNADICLPSNITQVLRYDVNLDCLQDDINVIELIPPQVPGQLVWVEFLILPDIQQPINH
jgi:hypothetical protein